MLLLLLLIRTLTFLSVDVSCVSFIAHQDKRKYELIWSSAVFNHLF